MGFSPKRKVILDKTIHLLKEMTSSWKQKKCCSKWRHSASWSQVIPFFETAFFFQEPVPLSKRNTEHTPSKIYHLIQGMHGNMYCILKSNAFCSQELAHWMWWLPAIPSLFYLVFFALGPSYIPWTITAELFSQASRPAAMSVAVGFNWFVYFMVELGFPTMHVS